jgi:hypothetical protein
MSQGEKIIGAIVAIGLVTTVILPGRMTPQVIGAAGSAGSMFLGTAMALPKYAG